MITAGNTDFTIIDEKICNLSASHLCFARGNPLHITFLFLHFQKLKPNATENFNLKALLGFSVSFSHICVKRQTDNLTDCPLNGSTKHKLRSALCFRLRVLNIPWCPKKISNLQKYRLTQPLWCSKKLQRVSGLHFMTLYSILYRTQNTAALTCVFLLQRNIWVSRQFVSTNKSFGRKSHLWGNDTCKINFSKLAKHDNF